MAHTKAISAPVFMFSKLVLWQYRAYVLEGICDVWMTSCVHDLACLSFLIGLAKRGVIYELHGRW
jgi:hypothetical protein